MTINPLHIIDLGCGPGDLTATIKSHYPQASVVGVDLSEPMLTYAKKHTSDITYIKASARNLPFASASTDLIIANLLIPWLPDVKSVLLECKRVLKPNGLFICTALGPDTLREIASVAGEYMVPNLMDMHDLGDLMLEVGLSDPVMDVNTYTASYRNVATLTNELIDAGLLGRDLPCDMALNSLDISFELVHGHAFTPATSSQKTVNGEVTVSLDGLRKSLREKS